MLPFCGAVTACRSVARRSAKLFLSYVRTKSTKKRSSSSFACQRAEPPVSYGVACSCSRAVTLPSHAHSRCALLELPHHFHAKPGDGSAAPCAVCTPLKSQPLRMRAAARSLFVMCAVLLTSADLQSGAWPRCVAPPWSRLRAPEPRRASECRNALAIGDPLCQHGGMLHSNSNSAPTSCAACDCPPGWGGIDCSRACAALRVNRRSVVHGA